MADSEPSSSEIKFEETSPDALKNTPSNIAKLEDIIEQCEGRQKYLAGTKSPSDGEDVRWYFCKVHLIENQLAAAVPQMEIVGRGEYFRFGMRDSLALEASFLQREEELLSAWWKEYAECSDGPSGSYVGSVHSSDVTSQPYSSEGDCSNQIYAIEEERVGVPVKGGLYEVDLTKRHCFPIYWHGENRRVLRGHWFARKAGIEWLPLREDVAEQLEFAYRCQIWHRRTFQPSGLFAARIDLQGSRQGLHALFTGEDDTWEAWLGVDNSGFSSITWRGNGTKLRRGFASSGSLKPTQDELRQQKEEETDDYCSQVPVRHLVFMVHGIGQRLEKANLVDDVATFRNIAANLAERHLTPHQRETQRVLFIPCQWRRGLKLGGESAVEKITLDGVRGLRVTLSATVHDVLYYMSPIYCQEIINSVSNQLNRLYLKFIKRNPGYDGKVSIYGHSLGSVLSYDILCHQESLPSPFSMQNLYNGCVGAGNSVVEEDDQSTVPGSATDLGRENVSRNMEDSDFLAASVGERDNLSPQLDGDESMGERDNLSPQLDGDESTRFISAAIDPFPISHIESDSSKLGGSPNQADNSGSSFIKNGNMSSDKEESQELDLDSSDLFYQQENGLGADQNIISRIPDYAMNKMERDTSGNVGVKDKLICLLREEVESLKARIAELESRQSNSLILSHCVEDSGQEAQQGEEVDKDTSNRSFLRKTSSEQDGSRKTYTPYITYTKLEFKVDTFFAVGSPLGVFLALRNVRIGIGEGQEYWQDERISEEMPACRKMFNIFHPFDPVAYRVEPLVSKEYINKRPVIIPYHKGGKRLHIGFQDLTEDLAARSQAVMNRLNLMKVQVVNVLSRNKDKKQEAIEDVQDTETRTYGSIMMERLTGSDDGRIDHMLQDATFEHAYISAIGSHTSYWRDYDTALFILKHLYHDIPEEPDTFEPLSEKRRILGVQSCQSEVMGEELPLTFSDKVLVREFSRKAKKVMKNT